MQRFRLLPHAAALLAACLFAAPPAVADAPRIAETWISAGQAGEEMDSLAVWPRSGSAPWLIATAKDSQRLLVFDADTGARIGSHGEPGNGPALRASARALHRLGREKEAFARIEAASKLGQARFDEWLERGFWLMDEERHDEACWCFEAAIAIKDDDPTAWLMRGMMEKAAGRCEDALVSLERSLDLDPQRGTAWALTAEVMEALGQHHEAGLCRETAQKLGL